jgi:hypothetical protein
MENETEIRESKAFATGLFQGAQVVFNYMKDRYSLIAEAEVNSEIGHRGASIKGLWMRAYAWMQTIGRLNNPLDIQAISVGNRALLEITVDLILLHHDKTNKSGWKMIWWGESEKLKASEQVVNFYSEQKLAVPDRYEAQEEFYRNRKSIIEDMRKTLWPNRKNPASHPDRWTGKGSLFDDIVDADKLYGFVVKDEIGFTLAEYYRTEYRKMNWRIHSGVASFLNQPPQAFNYSCGFALKACADFAMLSTKIVMMDFGISVPVGRLEDEWEEVKNKRNYYYAQELYEFHSRE